MSADSLFNVVFEGRTLPGIPQEEGIKTLAGLLQKTPDEIAHLFNARPRVIKSGVSRETALKYRKTLQNAGLACNITPAGSSSPPDTATTNPPFTKDKPSAPPAGNAEAAEQEIQTNTENKDEADNACPSTPWNEYWKGATVLSLLVTALALFSPNAQPFKIGLLTAALLILNYPLIRFLFRLKDKNIGFIIAVSILFGGTPILLYIYYLAVLGFGKLIRVQRFFEIYLLLCLILVGTISIFDPANIQDAQTSRPQSKNEISPIIKTNLHRLHTAMQTYGVETMTGHEALTENTFKKIIFKQLPRDTANKFLQALDNGVLKLRGTVFEHRVGVRRDDKWIILNARGDIFRAEKFKK